MAIIFGSARNGENGAHGNKAGDQSGGEVSTQEFYMHSKGWYGYRAKSVTYANNLATAMQQACDNNHIGYDQDDRLTLLTQYKKVGSIKAITTNCECDCSSLVRVCIYQATGTLLSDFDTSGEPSVLASSGLFDKVTVNSSADVYNGDILVTKTKGHTGIIVSGRARSSSSGTTTSGTGTTSGTKSSGTVSPKSGPDSSISGKYTVTASELNIRKGPGTNYDIITEVAYGTTVQNYGYYTDVSGVRWYYVAVNGVEGFACGTYLSKGSTTSSTTSSTPSYTVGNTYTVQADHLAVRSGAGTNYSKKAKSQLTSDGQKNAYSDGCLKKGTKVTCKATKTVSGNVWMQIPSGWVAAYYNKNKYVK